TIFGLMAFTALFTFGFMVKGGVVVKRYVWVLAQIAATGGLIFMHYLFFQGVFRINAICPWCFTIWMVTIPAFWYITLYNLQQNNILTPKKLKSTVGFMNRHHGDILFVWYLIIFGILLEHFWYYWKTLI